MKRLAFPAVYVSAAVLAMAANPANELATGRERPPADHEFYRPAEPPPALAFESPDYAGVRRFLPPVDVDGWVKTARQWAAGIGLPVYAR